MKRLSILLLGAVGCSSTVDIQVKLVDPCNQDAIASMDYLSFVPRGDGLDSEALATTVELGEGTNSSSALKIPLAADFSLVVAGYRGEFRTGAADGLGVSAKRDLSNAEGVVPIQALFALANSFYQTSDLGDPKTCTQMQVDRYGATATYLPDSGKVLIVGGAKIIDQGGGNFAIDYPRIVELYDPASGTFQAVAELRIGGARAFHTATLLKDGRVLVAGGEATSMGITNALKSAFIIDPRDPDDVKISEGGLALRKERTGHKAVALDDGKVLLIGGRVLLPGAALPSDHTYLKSIEVFDPEAGIFTFPTDANQNALELSVGRFGHTATLLKTGKDVFVAGGMDQTGPVLSVEVVRFGGAAPSITVASDTTNVGPIFHAADLAQNGAVLISGGYATVSDAEPQGEAPKNPSQNVEMWNFNESTGAASKSCNASLSTGRGFHTVSMSNRYAIFIGGRGAQGEPIGDAEVATLALGANCFTGPPESRPMATPRAYHSVAKMTGSGEIFVTGGRAQNPGDVYGQSIKAAEIFSPKREP